MAANWMKGLTRDQITQRVKENSERNYRDRIEAELRKQRLIDAGWDDLAESCKVLGSYNPVTNPYSWGKFEEDLNALRARKEAIASGKETT